MADQPGQELHTRLEYSHHQQESVTSRCIAQSHAKLHWEIHSKQRETKAMCMKPSKTKPLLSQHRGPMQPLSMGLKLGDDTSEPVMEKRDESSPASMGGSWKTGTCISLSAGYVN